MLGFFGQSRFMRTHTADNRLGEWDGGGCINLRGEKETRNYGTRIKKKQEIESLGESGLRSKGWETVIVSESEWG